MANSLENLRELSMNSLYNRFMHTIVELKEEAYWDWQ